MPPHDPIAPLGSHALSTLVAAGLGDVIGVRGIRSITFERAVHLGDGVAVAVDVEQTRDVTSDAVEVGTSWRLVNERGETLVSVRADMLCRRSAETAPQFDDADPDDIDNIPV